MSEKLKIVIVEDQYTINMLLTYMFQKMNNFDVLSFYDIKHSDLEALFQYNPDAIILDIILPSLQGGEILSWYRNKEIETGRNPIPIVILSVKSTQQEILRYYDMGATNYFTKPFSPKILILKVLSMIRASKRV